MSPPLLTSATMRSAPPRWPVEPSPDEAPAVVSHLSRQISATAEVEIMPLPIYLAATMSMACYLRATSNTDLRKFLDTGVRLITGDKAG
jgi:hypothetical protein